MRERWIDVALMFGLFLVAGIIVWTLFGAPKPKLQSASTPQQVTPAQPTPLTPANPETTDSGVVSAVSPDAVADETIVSIESIVNNNSTEGETQNTQVEEPEMPDVSLSEGSLELNRVGFSYVTGGPGACGMTLEPWKHVAVSRDILEKYPCGSSITIALDKTTANRDSFTAVVGDTMSSVHRLTVNVYVGTDEPALNYGVRAGQLIP